MDLEKIENKLNNLEERIITKVESHFNQYILTDYVEMKTTYKGDASSDILYFIGEYDWYLYWIDCASEMHQIINDLIDQGERQVDTLLLSAINLKRIVDSHLKKFNKDEQELLYDMGLIDIDPKKEQHIELNSNPIRLNSKGDSKENTLKEFHDFLISHALIDQPYNSAFLSHFDDKEPISLLIFEKDMSTLIRLIKYMMDRGYLFGNSYEVEGLIKDHFSIRSKSEYTSLKRLIYKHTNNSNLCEYKDSLDKIFV